MDNLILASECDEIGFGVSARRRGKRIGPGTANEILALFSRVPEYGKTGLAHFEEIQLYVDGISKDRISDIACNFLKYFLIDFTIDQCHEHGIPLADIRLKSLYNYKAQKFETNIGSVNLDKARFLNTWRRRDAPCQTFRIPSSKTTTQPVNGLKTTFGLMAGNGGAKLVHGSGGIVSLRAEQNSAT